MVCVKKICSVLLVLMVLAMVPISPAEAEEIPFNVEMVSNGGFETLTADKTAADGWSGFRTWTYGSVLSIVSAEDNPDNVHSGNYAVKYDTKAGDNPFLQQGITGILARCKYRVSFWYKGVIPSGGMSVKFEQSGTLGGNEYYTTSFGSASDWTYAEHDFYMGEGVNFSRIMPRTYAEGSVIYLDDISLKLIDTPDMLDMETDWVFYYQNYDEATVTLTMDEFYDEADYTVDFKIIRGVMAFSEVRGLTFKDHKIECKLDITELDKKTKYMLQAVVNDTGGNTVKTLKQYIYRIDRPTALTEDGVYMIDGQPFEPMLIYHMGMNDIEVAKEAGINVMQWSASSADKEKALAELDVLHEAGMMAAVVCYWGMYPAGHENNAERVKQFVTDIKDHPAVFCYMVMDEPFSHASDFGGIEATEDYLRISYEIIRTIDDKHPVYLCEDQKKMYRTSAKYVDCLGMDPYPGNGDFGRHVADMTLAAVEGTRGEKPVYTVTQSMSWKGVIPDGTMLRTQLYQAMMAGAKCVGYYPWIPDNKEIDVNLNVSRYWDTMTAFNDLDKPLLYEYYGRGEHETFNSYKDNDLWYESWIDGSGIYMAVLNRKSENSTVTVSLKGADGETIPEDYIMTVVSGGDVSSVIREEDSFTVELTGYQAVLYRLMQVEPGKEILILDAAGDEMIDGVSLSRRITAYAEGLDDGERLYLALYSDKDGVERLKDVEVADAQDGELLSCTVDNSEKRGLKVKAFVWSENMGVRLIKTFE